MLELNDIHVFADKKEIVKGVSLKINQKELHVLMGPNGSGKSTLIYGIMKHPSFNVKGNMFLDDEDISNHSTDKIVKKGLTAIYQNTPDLEGIRLRNLLWNITKDYVKDSKEFTNLLSHYLELLNLDKNFLERDFSGFSGGEKKKLELLQILLLNPKYVLIDEIDSGVDVDNLKVIAKVISRLKESKGILLITHYTRILNYLDVDYVHLYKEGRIIKSGDYSLAKMIEEKGYNSL